jgi:hypothetical protein
MPTIMTTVAHVVAVTMPTRPRPGIDPAIFSVPTEERP